MTVRSMAFQIKEETYIEASPSSWEQDTVASFLTILAPLLIPYSFASMALSVPSAIVYESSSPFWDWGCLYRNLGANPPRCHVGNAILNGLWWWVIPPGLAIAIMGMTFAFLGFAMDRILHPKLRTR